MVALLAGMMVIDPFTLTAQVSSPCIPTNDLPGSFDYYYGWNTEDRTGYTLFMPPWYFNTSAMRELFLYPNFDADSTRVDLYREAFVVALLQGELSSRLNEEEQGRRSIQILAEETASQLELSPKLLELLNAIRFGYIYEVDPNSIEEIVNEWTDYVNSEVFGQRLKMLGKCLQTLGFGLRLYGDGVQQTFYHSLATANAVERMDALDTYFQMYSWPDTTMKAGYELAKQEVNDYLNSDTLFLTSALRAIMANPGYYAVSGTDLAIQWISVLKASALSASTVAAASGVFTVVGVLVEFASDMQDFRILCAEAAVDSWLCGAVESYPWPQEVGTYCESTRRLYYQSMMMRCALSYSSYKLHDELLAFKWRLTDIGQLLGDIVSGQYDDIQTFRSDVLNAYMNSIATRAMEYQDVFDWLLVQTPNIISYRTIATNPPSIKFIFDRDMDANSFSPSCVSVVGSSSGPHDPSPAFDHDNYELSLSPTGEFEYEEEVVVTLESCVQSIDGIQFNGTYELPFIIEPEPQLLIATWSGRNGTISEDQYVSIGGGVVLTATPDPGFQSDRWYVDGQMVKEGGNEYTLDNIQSSHSVGVTFKEFVPSEINLTSPNGGQLFAHGKSMPITWTWSGELGDNVKIELLEGTLVKKTVESSTRNDGSFVWKVTTDAGTGSDFKIRISSDESPSISDQSENVFTIDPYVLVPEWIEIATIQELQAIGSDAAKPMDGKYRLTSDIIAYGVSPAFKPIGNVSDNRFEGILDGKGLAIEGLTIIEPTFSYVGLFAGIGIDGIVKNLTIADFYIEGDEYVGTFAGLNRGCIINCISTNDDGLPYYSTSGIDGSEKLGGIVGENRGLLRNCQVIRTGNDVEIACDGPYVGGIAGVSAPDTATAQIEFCFSNCYVESRGTNAGYTGGIVGENRGSIEECGATGLVDGSRDRIGGIVGINDGGTITNCYFTGEVKGLDFIGGIVGWLQPGSVEGCYVSCGISAHLKGGISGRNQGTISRSFWDTQATGLSVATYDGGGAIINSHGKTSSEMTHEITYTTLHSTNWDFDNVWTINECVGFPQLRATGDRLASSSEMIAYSGQNDGVHLSWSAVVYYLAGTEHQAVYTVLRSDSADQNAEMIELSSWQQDTSFIDETAQPEETYFYWIKAAATISGARESELAGPISGSRIHPPAPSPTDVSSSQGFIQSVLVEWDATDANYYQVYRTPVTALQAGLQDESLKLASDPITGWQRSMEFVDIPPESEEKYLYSIASALDSNGLAASLLSISDTGSFSNTDDELPLIDVSITPMYPISSQPVSADLSVQDNGIINEVQLNWESADDSIVTWQVGDTNYFETAHMLGSFQANDTLHVWVVAIDSAGNEGESEHIVAVIIEENVVTPSQPIGESVLLTGETALFTTGGATSNLGDIVEYRFDWGDSTFASSGDSAVSKCWSVDGIYLIRAQARSVPHPEIESPWSDPFPVCVDSRPPIVTITTNLGQDLNFGGDTILIAGEAMEQLPGSGIDTIYSLPRVLNEGNNTSWGFRIPLAQVGETTEVVIAACDRAGNTGTDTIRVTKVIPEFTISGQAFYLESYSLDYCSVWDDANQMWRTAIPGLAVRLYYLGTMDICVQSTTDSCGYYLLAVTKGNYWMGVGGFYYDSVLYQFDETYFETVSNTNIIGMNLFFPDGPQGIPTDVTEGKPHTLPDMYRLSQNYPNPFNPETQIEFSLAQQCFVTIKIFNILGQRVKQLVSEQLPVGKWTVCWDGKDDKGNDVSSGIYFYRLQAGEFVQTKKMLLLK